MSIAHFYLTNRERFIGLGRELGPAESEMVVPATPEWSVRDNFAHMAGVATDILSGKLEGATTDPWTQAQVDARRDRSLPEILDEWESIGPALDELVQAAGDAMDPRLIMDMWTHEQDVRGAVHRPGGDDPDLLEWIVGRVVPSWVRRAAEQGLPAIEVRCGPTVAAPDGPAEAVLTIEPFEAARVLTGRRSQAQYLALDWTGDAEPLQFVPVLVAFSLSRQDIIDAR